MGCTVLGFRGLDARLLREGKLVIRTAELAAGAVQLAQGLPREIVGVVGVPRSGMIAASIVAGCLHVRLATISRGTVVEVDGGVRCDRGLQKSGGWAVVDDTVSSGKAMREAVFTARRGGCGEEVLRAAVFSTEFGLTGVDVAVGVCGGPHYLEWNLPNAGVALAGGWDLDGVICEAVPPGCTAKAGAYKEWLESARPYLLPRRARVPLIVSARPEWARAMTTKWLEYWGVRYEQLELAPWQGPWASPPGRGVGEWKASVLVESRLRRYVEDDAEVAAGICSAWSGEVVCLGSGRVLGGDRLAEVDEEFSRWVRSRACCKGVHAKSAG